MSHLLSNQTSKEILQANARQTVPASCKSYMNLRL